MENKENKMCTRDVWHCVYSISSLLLNKNESPHGKWFLYTFYILDSFKIKLFLIENLPGGIIHNNVNVLDN